MLWMLRSRLPTFCRSVILPGISMQHGRPPNWSFSPPVEANMPAFPKIATWVIKREQMNFEPLGAYLRRPSDPPQPPQTHEPTRQSLLDPLTPLKVTRRSHRRRIRNALSTQSDRRYPCNMRCAQLQNPSADSSRGTCVAAHRPR